MVDPVTTAAIGWGLSASGWLISPILSRFINKCFESLDQDVPQKLQHLETTLLPQLKIMMDTMQQSQHRSTLEKLLEKLKEAYYEADDMLDLVKYECREREVKSESTGSKILLVFKPPYFSPQKNNLLKSLKKLENLVSDARELVKDINLPSSSSSNVATASSKQQYRDTTSSPPPLVIGRDQDRDKIIKLLREDTPESSRNSNCFSVIGIYGIGGLGKTTLVQYVCDFEKTAKHFDLVMWVYVSREFNVNNILSKMYESACNRSCEDFKNLDVLQNKVEEQLTGKKFLLVLDDAWCNKGVSASQLDQLFAPLKAGEKGSKIFVTTRMEDVAKDLGASNPIQLRELDHDQFLALFMHYALGNVIMDENNSETELKRIGKKIAEKMKRSPLAARAIAGQLSRKLDPLFWLSMLSQDLLSDTKGSLFLSFQHLEPPLQRCFAFCSLFPKGFLFTRDDLLDLWIAEQFIETENSDEYVRDIARRYLYELVSSSFLQHVENKTSPFWPMIKQDCYSVHDLLHDLAEDITGNEYFRIESEETREIPIQVRHLFVNVNMQREHIKNICKIEGLRTIIINKRQSNINEDDANALFRRLKKLHVVHLGNCYVESNVKTRFLKSIICLKHLKFLDFPYDLPDLNWKPLNRLYNLCFLRVYYSGFPNFGRFYSVQTLPPFSVKKKNGFEWKQLGNLNYLYGHLELKNLANVASMEDALAAQLVKKVGLCSLIFDWGCVGRCSCYPVSQRKLSNVEICEGLRPPPRITNISIRGYQSETYPRWILEIDNYVNNLEYFELVRCSYLKFLPKSFEMLPGLLGISITNLPKLRTWAPLPVTIIQLHISYCHSLGFISKVELEMVISSASMQIPQIAHFFENFSSDWDFHLQTQFRVIENMIKSRNDEENYTSDDIAEQGQLHADPSDLQALLKKRLDLIMQLEDANNKLILPSSVQKLTIESCAVTNNVLWEGLQKVTSLTHLRLHDIITITSIPKEVLSCLRKLQSLSIMNCLFLTSLSGLETLHSLKMLMIDSCPVLTLGTDEVPSSLEELTLRSWRPSDDIFRGLVSLENLEVSSCPSIVSPRIGCSKSLKTIKFSNCSNLNSIHGLNKLKNIRYFSVTGHPILTCQSMDDKLSVLSMFDTNEISLVEKLLSRKAISSLQSLALYDLPEGSLEAEQVEVFEHLSSLKNLHFSSCRMLFLPANLASLTSLKYLTIHTCMNLSVLPNFPTSLESISIRECNPDFLKSCKKSGSPNYQKLAHVPKKNISDPSSKTLPD